MATELKRSNFESENVIPLDKLPNAVVVGKHLVEGYCKYCGKNMGKMEMAGYYNHHCKDRQEILDALIEENEGFRF